MGLGQYNGNTDIKTIRKYFVGTTALRAGQLLCLQHDATANNADPKLRLGNAVAAIDANNLNYVVGVVAPTEAGKVGPIWVELEQPQSGDTCFAEVEGTAAVVLGDLLEPGSALGCLIFATAAAGDNLFRALQPRPSAGRVSILVYKI